jgi:hypothetical protein
MAAKTNGDILRAQADAQGIPPTSIWKAQEGLKLARTQADKEALARLMLRHGRLTDKAILWIGDNYPSVRE